MTIKVDLGTVFPGVMLFLMGILVLLACGFAFLIWLFIRYELSGVLILVFFGLALIGAGLYLIFRGSSILALMRMK